MFLLLLGDDKVASGFQVPVQNVVIVLSLVLENVLPVIKLFLVVVNALNHSLLLFLSKWGITFRLASCCWARAARAGEGDEGFQGRAG